MKKEFGDIKITRGKKHVFLGIDIEITPQKTIEIDMSAQLQEAIEMFGEEINGIMSSIATHNLFKVTEDAEPLDSRKQEILHSVTAKLLFITKRGRPDLETLISFLTTRLSKSDVDD